MTRIRFPVAKARPRRPRQSAEKQNLLHKLNEFLRQSEPEVVRFLYTNLHAQGSSVTYQELREAYLNGGMTEAQFQNWQQEYSKLVKDILLPKWEQAAAEAAQEKKDQHPGFFYEPGIGAAAEWIEQHGAELVTNLSLEQRDAVNAVIRHVSGHAAITPDEAAKIIRPIIGLTKPQALANARYQETIREKYRENHPKSLPGTAERVAREAGAKYAARQHRYRAVVIARTELAFGYNAGAYGATKDAQRQGLLGDCVKVWLTAYDARVCPVCSLLDEEKVHMDALFSNGKLLPPGHPNCRCAVGYVEMETKDRTELTFDVETDTLESDLYHMPRAKIEQFLLKPGAKHAKEFFDAGYSPNDVERLNQDIYHQFDESKKEKVVVTDEGAEKFSIFMYLGDNNKRFRTVWQKDTQDSKPRFITAYRDGK